MTSRRHGLTIVELLVAMTVMVVVFAVIGALLAQQSRVIGLSQSINEAELSARTVAEAIAQDFQLAGSRAVFTGGTVDYAPGAIAPGCSQSERSGCIVARSVGGGGAVALAATAADVNGYTIYYRTSIDPGVQCRRVDYAWIDGSMYRSDVPCPVPPSADALTIDLPSSLFATSVVGFDVSLRCSDDSTVVLASDCYGVSSEDFVRQAFVAVEVQLAGRHPTSSRMEMAATTPNLRPSVNYGGN